MKTNINIAEILKDMPKGTKLYSTAFGEVTYDAIAYGGQKIWVLTKDKNYKIYLSDGRYRSGGEVTLYPSKEMRDWSKFAWKKGDVLVGVGQRIIFEKFIDENYTRFQGKYSLSTYEDETLVANKRCYTSDFRKLDDSGNVENYFKELEEKLGGKLNFQTLKIEKLKPEFKDGDIVVTDAVPSMCYSKCIFILKGDLYAHESRANSYVFYNINNNSIIFGVSDKTIRDRNIHLATELEKQQLFNAIAKKGNRWDSEKKEVVDFKPKVKLKPFDKVLVRDSESDKWRTNLFSYVDKDKCYHCVYANWLHCIPYDGNEHLLGTTNNSDKYNE